MTCGAEVLDQLLALPSGNCWPRAVMGPINNNAPANNTVNALFMASSAAEPRLLHFYTSMVSVYKGYQCGGLGGGHYNLGNLAGTAIADESKLQTVFAFQVGRFSAAKPQKNRNISRKDAKAAKKKKQYLSELGVLRALAGGISESEMFHVSENLREP